MHQYSEQQKRMLRVNVYGSKPSSKQIGKAVRSIWLWPV